MKPSYLPRLAQDSAKTEFSCNFSTTMECMNYWKDRKRPREEGLLHYSSGMESPSPQAQLLALTPTAFSYYVYRERFKSTILAASKQGSCPHHLLPVSLSEPVCSWTVGYRCWCSVSAFLALPHRPPGWGPNFLREPESLSLWPQRVSPGLSPLSTPILTQTIHLSLNITANSYILLPMPAPMTETPSSSFCWTSIHL